ncbi:MAG TPA: DUF1206 domain-containing protein [Miltoncostaeaceae bacterium]|nr:DUF1206 domain-containing protein [Miltoncostaeaceae bacterium]
MSIRTTDVGSQAQRAVRREWLEPAARAGLVAKAALYAIIGALALAVAVGAGGETTDQKGALATLADEPVGGVLIGLLAAGLLGYGLWRLVQAIFDTGGEGDDATGVVTRVGYGASAAIHLALFAFAIRLLADSGGSSSGSGSSQEQQTTAGVLGWPGGRAIVIVAALVIIGVGAYNAYRGITKGFMEDLRVGGRARRLVEPLGVVGHVARGVVFALVGVFLMKAAVEYDPSEAEGLDGALARLADQPYGQVLLGLAAAGLLAYAAYCVADARYRDPARV